MALTISSLAVNSGDPIMHELGFRHMIETHLPYLKKPETSDVITINADEVYQFEADFYGLLNKYGYTPDWYYVLLRVNGFYSPHEFGKQVHDPYRPSLNTTLIIPRNTVIDELKKLYISNRR